MDRRALLASLTATLAGTAGCVSGETPGGRPAFTSTEPEPADPTQSDGPTTTDGTDAGTATGESPEPAPASDAFADVECPSFDDRADRTVCYHAAYPAGSTGTDADLLLTAEPEVFDPDLDDATVETLEFTLYNRSDWSISFNPYDWGIERRADGGWTHVAPDAVPEPLVAVGPGGTMRWELPSEPHPSPSDGTYRLRVALDPGVYAFDITVSYGGFAVETATETSPPDERVELVALFRVERAFDPTGGDRDTSSDPDQPVSDEA